MEDITDVNDFRLLGRRPAESKHLFESMFATICQRLTCDSEKKMLIPSPSLYEAKQLIPLNVVTMKTKRNMFGNIVKEYTTYDFSLANLLNGPPLQEFEIDKSKYRSHKSYTCTYDAYASNGKIAGYFMDIIVGSLSLFFNITITCKLENLIERRIGYQNFMSALKERKLNMNHHFIREIKDAKQVLCVIRNVIKTSSKAEIKCTEKRGGSINLSKKISKFLRVQSIIETIESSVEDMVIEKGTTLAYSIWELGVDVDSGEITPIMMAHNSGGFFESDIRKIEKCSLEKYHCIKEVRKIKKYSLEKCRCNKDQQKMQSNVNRSDKPNEGDPPPPNDDEKVEESNSQLSEESLCEPSGGSSPIDDEVEKAATLRYLQVILQPLRDCTEADSQRIKLLLLKLMTCYSDVVAISKILSKAEDRFLNEDEDTIDKQFINKNTVWSILKFVEVQTEEGRVLYEKEATPILTAVSYVIDAILEFENDDIDIIYHCDEPQLKTLSKIFESAVASSMPISIDVDMSSVLKEPVSSFLTQKKFTVCNDSIQPPKTVTSNVDCIFCVLYCLSQN